MDEYAAEGVCIGNPEMESAMTDLTRLELALAYSSEKLQNLHSLSMHLLAWDPDPDTLTVENSHISPELLDRALTYDLLSGIVASEVREMEGFIGTLQIEVVDTRDKISSCSDSREPITIIEDKLYSSEESLNQVLEQLIELEKLSAELQRRFSSHGLENWIQNSAKESRMNVKSKIPMRTLEKLFAREAELEKRLSKARQKEDDLKVKLHYTEQVTFHMEETSEVIWGRFLEAENSSVSLMGISKELLGKLQILQFNLNSSMKRETDAKSKLQDCVELLKAKDLLLQEHVAKNSKLSALEEKVKQLEEHVVESEIRVKKVTSLFEESQSHLSEMEQVVESLEESNSMAETRAETAEAKVTQLTETNLELTEEISFLKGSNSSEKVSLLEKQLRELEIQLLHAKASLEASQEQQNMLYSAIWDMETLIDDLKSKVAKAENKTDNVEEQCIVLSEANFELNKEIEFLRSRTEYLESSLDKANNAKAVSAREIDSRMKLVMDMIRKLANERERIHKQLHSARKDDETLTGKLKKMQELAYGAVDRNVAVDDEEILLPKHDLGKTEEARLWHKVSRQVDESSGDAFIGTSEIEEASISANDDNGMDLEPETGRKAAKGGGKLVQTLILMAIFVGLLAAASLYWPENKIWVL